MKGSLGMTLAWNGLYSAVTGAVLLISFRTFDATLGVESWFLVVAGASLIGYGVLIAELGRRENPVPAAWFASAMDIAWVVGAVVTLVGFPNALTNSGRWALIFASIPVAVFAFVQLWQLRSAVES